MPPPSLSELDQYFSSEAVLIKGLPQILEIVEEYGVGDIRRWNLRITKLVQNKKAAPRMAGICIMRMSIEKSEQCILECGIHWMRMLISVLQNRQEPPKTLDFCAKTISSILLCAPAVLWRDISQLSSSLTESLLALTSKSNPTLTLTLLSTLIHLRPKKPNAAVSGIALSLIDSPKKSTRSKAALVYVQANSMQWRESFLHVIEELNTCFSFLDTLVYSSALGIQPPENLVSAAVRLAALFNLAAAFFQHPPVSPVKVPLGSLITVIIRVLESPYRTLLHPVYRACLTLLSCLASSLNHHLLPHISALLPGITRLLSHPTLAQTVYSTLTVFLPRYSHAVSSNKLFPSIISQAISHSNQPSISSSANSFLISGLENVCLSQKLKGQIERLMIISRNMLGIQQCILSPGHVQNLILPHAIRTLHSSPHFSSIDPVIHPRFCPLNTSLEEATNSENQLTTEEDPQNPLEKQTFNTRVENQEMEQNEGIESTEKRTIDNQSNYFTNQDIQTSENPMSKISMETNSDSDEMPIIDINDTDDDASMS